MRLKQRLMFQAAGMQRRPAAKPKKEKAEMFHDVTQEANFVKFLRQISPKLPSGTISHETIAIGLLERLRHVVSKNAPAGDIGRLDDEMIAHLVGWNGGANELIAPLLDCGWLVQCTRYRLVMSDWENTAPTWVKGVVARQKLQWATPQGGEGADSTKCGTKGATAVATYKRKGNETKPNEPVQNEFAPAEAFDDFWKECAYNRKGKGEAKKSFEKAVKSVASEKQCDKADAAKHIIDAMRVFGRSEDAHPTDRNPIMPKTWLNQGRYDDDRSTWGSPVDSNGHQAPPPQQMTEAARRKIAARGGK